MNLFWKFKTRLSVLMNRDKSKNEQESPKVQILKSNKIDICNFTDYFKPIANQPLQSISEPTLFSKSIKETRKIGPFSSQVTSSLPNLPTSPLTITPSSNGLPSNVSHILGYFNQYSIIREIGEGSFSKVHLVYNNEIGKYFACKSISKKRIKKKNMWKKGPATRDEKFDFMDYVRQEIEILKQIAQHPNLATLIEVLEDPDYDNLYMVFELCEFGSIMKLKLLERVPCFSEQLAKRFFRDVVSGLEYLHSLEIIHRDLKPENILLNAKCQAVICDFSISFSKPKSRPTSSHASTPTEEVGLGLKKSPSQAGNDMLTPAFTPPELISATDQPVEPEFDTQSDIWALGLTLYCFTHGKLPFESDQLLVLYHQIIKENPIVDADLSKELKDLLQGLLQKDPKKRLTLKQVKRHPWLKK